MKKYLVCLALLFSVISVKAAPPSDQSIEQMINVMQVQKMLDQMITQMDSSMEQAMQQSLQGKTSTDAQKAKIADFQKKVSGMIKDELSLAKMKDVYIQVYRETFTQDEVSSIIAFYSSAAGKAMVEKVPLAMQKAGTLMQGRIGPMTQKLQEMMDQFQKDLEKTK